MADIGAVDSLEIRWPSGLRQQFEDLPINSSIQVTEGQSCWVSVYAGAEPEPNASDAWVA